MMLKSHAADTRLSDATGGAIANRLAPRPHPGRGGDWVGTGTFSGSLDGEC